MMIQNNSQSPLGGVLGGRYRIRETIGQGGMANVYLAEDLHSRSYVALKMMRDELSGDPEFIRRFATEARAAASLDHPNIVKVLDYGQDRDMRYIVQEYVHGSTLKEIIQRLSALDWKLAVPLMIQISLALEHAHRRGIIHRDMKPQNVLVTPDMIAKVTDFGIARASNANTITLTGGVAFGSVHYFSPEQARGGHITERSDLYSLGIMLYEMVTGELPFDGDSSVAVAIKQLQDMPIRPSMIRPGIPRALDDIIFKAIQKSPDRRYQSAREFVDELDAFMVDPNGVYGVVYQGSEDWGSTTALGVQKKQSNFRKVREIENNISHRRKTKYRDTALILTVVVISVVLMIYLLVSVLESFSGSTVATDSDNMVEIITLTGKRIEEVTVLLQQKYGVGTDRIQINYQNNATVQAGFVFKQIPEAGLKQNKDRLNFTLTVSAGEETVTVPALNLRTVEEARIILRDLGLAPSERREYSETIEKGRIVRCEPVEGKVLPRNSTVFLYVSQGKSKTKVPSVEGMKWPEAKRILEENNLIITEGNSLKVDSEGKRVPIPEVDRVVISQKVPKDTEVQSGSALIVDYGTQEEFDNKGNSSVQGMIRMPNLVGMRYDQVRTLISSWNATNSVRITGTTDLPDHSLVVHSQSVSPGWEFDPTKSTLVITLTPARNDNNYIIPTIPPFQGGGG